MKKTPSNRRFPKRHREKPPLFSQTSILIIASCLILTVCLGFYHIYDMQSQEVAGATDFNKEQATAMKQAIINPYYNSNGVIPMHAKELHRETPTLKNTQDPDLSDIENTFSMIDNDFNGLNSSLVIQPENLNQ